jgi:hypothetical protein
MDCFVASLLAMTAPVLRGENDFALADVPGNDEALDAIDDFSL